MSQVVVKSEEIIVDNYDYNSDEGEDIRLTLEDTGGDSHNQQQTFVSTSPKQHHIVTIGHTGSVDTQSMKIVSASPSGAQPKNMLENEKRIRREIANSNERRRMQSINAGFQSLRSLLPHHEGEKLSKAAILQQTAQYILDLESEKTHLLSKYSQLKRQMGQHEVDGGSTGATDAVAAGVNGKKRKLTDSVQQLQAISDSSDEGVGSMSPEPVTLVATNSAGVVTQTSSVKMPPNVGPPATTTTYISANVKELSELKTRLDNERKRRSLLEDRLRQLERQIFPANQYIQREVIEHTDNLHDEEIVIGVDMLPSVGQNQVVICSSLEDMQEEECDVVEEMNLREEEVIEEQTEYVEVPSRLQPILEAAIKAEPKVEVERISETLTKLKNDGKDCNKASTGRMYLTSTSRQNLETIVEAIRHLEGDHLFGDVAEQQKKSHKSQETPLELTIKPQQQRKLKAELSPFLHLKNGAPAAVTFVNAGGAQIKVAAGPSTQTVTNNTHTSSSSSSNSKTNHPVPAALIKAESSQQLQHQQQQQQVTITATSLKQCRPGVIVAKQLS